MDEHRPSWFSLRNLEKVLVRAQGCLDFVLLSSACRYSVAALDLLDLLGLAELTCQLKLFHLVGEAAHDFLARDHEVLLDERQLKPIASLPSEVGGNQQGIQPLRQCIEGGGETRRPAAQNHEVVCPGYSLFPVVTHSLRG